MHEKDDTMLNDFSFLVFYFYHLCCQKVVKCSQNSIEKMLILRGLRVFLIGFDSLIPCFSQAGSLVFQDFRLFCCQADQ